jgi:RNA polymerase sigma factor (sigma-70 family)
LQVERQKADEAEVAGWLKNLLSSGDVQYWGRVYEKYKKPVFIRCHRMLQNEEDAKDLTSDAFIKALENIHMYDLKRPFLPWLHRIASNLCVDFIRKNFRTRFMKGTDWENVRDETDPALGGEGDEALRIKVGKAVEKLKRPQKLCFCLFYLHQKSYDEIGRLTGYTYDEVRSHIQNGRRKFKMAFER